jgi:hypothetical protein
MVQAPELKTYAYEGQIRMTNIRVQPKWLQKLKEAQETDKELQQLKRKTQEKNGSDFQVDGDGLLCFRG